MTQKNIYVTNKDCNTPCSFISVIKQNIKNVIKSNYISTVQDAVFRTNNIFMHTFFFIKLYFCYLYKNKLEFPLIDTQFVLTVTKVVSFKTTNKGAKLNNNTQVLLDELNKFHDEYYKNISINYNFVSSSKLNQILIYETNKYITNLNTNIKVHFISHIKKLIYFLFGFKSKYECIRNDDKLTNKEKSLKYKDLDDKINSIYLDIINVTDDKFNSDKTYHELIKKHKQFIIPDKKKIKKDSIPYDVCASPQDYLKSMFYINTQLELLNDTTIRLFNVLPLSLSLIPKYITIDTTTLVNLLNTGGIKLSDGKKEIWDTFCYMNRKWFKKNKYDFNYMIETDGFGCSILFKSQNKNKRTINKKDNLKSNYIEDQENIKDILKNKTVVYNDPGIYKLLYCMKVNSDDEQKYFKYTKNKRKHELKEAKYTKNKNKIRKKDNINEHEKKLADSNFKTCNFKKLLKYLEKKSIVNKNTEEHYKNKKYIQYKFYTYINRQRSEENMLNKFEKKMGKPKKTVIIYGDWDRHGNHLKKNPPVVNNRLKDLLTKRGYKIYLINEYNTSKICNGCGKYLEKYKEKKRGEIWRLTCCVNNKCKLVKKLKNKKRIMNRDKNAVNNMYNIVEELRNGNKKPSIFTRKTC